MKIALGAGIGFLFGFFAHVFVEERLSTERNWKAIANWNSYLTNQNLRQRLRPAPDRIPNASLEALVASGGLNHIDIVLPKVLDRRDAAQHWMTFAQSHKEIVFMTGNPSYGTFDPAGIQPLHLNVWFKPVDEPVVQQLLRELEDKFGK